MARPVTPVFAAEVRVRGRAAGCAHAVAACRPRRRVFGAEVASASLPRCPSGQRLPLPAAPAPEPIPSPPKERRCPRWPPATLPKRRREPRPPSSAPKFARRLWPARCAARAAAGPGRGGRALPHQPPLESSSSARKMAPAGVTRRRIPSGWTFRQMLLPRMSPAPTGLDLPGAEGLASAPARAALRASRRASTSSRTPARSMAACSSCGTRSTPCRRLRRRNRYQQFGSAPPRSDTCRCAVYHHRRVPQASVPSYHELRGILIELP